MKTVAWRQAERDLYERARRDGCRGPRFDLLIEELWLYGFNVLRGWMRSGTIVARCADADCAIYVHASELEVWQQSTEVRDELAAEALTAAIEYFTRTVLPDDRWDPARGASLRTYFVNACLRAFRDVCRRWARQHRRRLSEIPVQMLERHRSASAPHEVVEQRDALRQILPHGSWEARAICALIYEENLSHSEICERLGGMSRKAVEGHMRRLRAHAKRLARSGAVTVPYVQADAAAAVTR